MISLLAVVLLAATSPAPTLAGVTLGAPLAEVRAAHPDAQSYAHSRGTLWTWKRPDGGTVDVFVDAKGAITSIDFTADPGEKGTIDLPCAPAFGIEGSHVNLEFAMESTQCKLDSIGVYELPDGSIIDVRFDGPGDGSFHRAIWYRPAPLVSLTGLAASDEAQALLSFAEAHDVGGIEAMKSSVAATQSAQLQGAYVVALYLADPQRNEAEFVANFPWRDVMAVSGLFQGKRFGVAPPVEALGTIAERHGNVAAIRLLFLGSAYSDGAVGEAFTGAVQTVAQRWPRQMLDALRSIPAQDRAKALRITAGCAHSSEVIALKPQDELDRALLAKIRTASPSTCP